jgi:hypothetical protein
MYGGALSPPWRLFESVWDEKRTCSSSLRSDVNDPQLPAYLLDKSHVDYFETAFKTIIEILRGFLELLPGLVNEFYQRWET